MGDVDARKALHLLERAFALISAKNEGENIDFMENEVNLENKDEIESLVDEIVESLYPLKAKYSVFYTPGQIYGLFKRIYEGKSSKNDGKYTESQGSVDRTPVNSGLISFHSSSSNQETENSLGGDSGIETFYSIESTPTGSTPCGGRSNSFMLNYEVMEDVGNSSKDLGKELTICATTELLRLLYIMSGYSHYLAYVHVKLKSLMRLEEGLYEMLDKNCESMALLEYYILSSIYHGLFVVDADEVFLDMYKDYLVYLPQAMYFTMVNFLSEKSTKEQINAFVELLSSIPIPLEFREAIGNTSDAQEDESDDDSSIDYESEEESPYDPIDGKALSKRYKGMYNKLWMYVIRDYHVNHGLSSEALVTLVEAMPSHVFPFSSNPLLFVDLLIDFLSHSSLNLQILSLRALMELVLYYGLDDAMILSVDVEEHAGEEKSASYFYLKLLKFLNIEYLDGDYGKCLLQVLYTALKSSMLPVKLISSFIKRLVQVSCVTDSLTTNALLSIALDLLIRHNKHCIHLVSDVQDKEGEEYLYELTLLLRHFNDATTKICGIYHSDLRDKNVVKLNVDDFVNLERNQLLKSIVCRIKKSEDSPFRENVQKSTFLVSKLF
ncbi:hypothetical protein BEWA_000780 [Theileria equi strain WA]|uniref:CCAAT-binding factor domain-containing protein n=1 Tax=Theileria equi strain WA TaxID=1537102 RepID=L0AZH3_THEEQ|nr:hypothetical protein BEWA_000780 [Theileria equi strain WA]AFZ80673.1 hypothetical protein BEWA_000780 [Theileria equi strain WA]|eukprot:XP_004830339.1 hypothetical protein BEWA_000780 [Theileria equi strain WA]